jgi:conjugal transfer pilus assembly protein TraB
MNSLGTALGSVRGRQYLLLAGIAASIIGTALFSVALTSPKQDSTRTQAPKTTSIVAPGSQVDPKDAWRGQADAQIKTIEQRAQEINQKNTELAQQNKEMLERLKKLEQVGLTLLPPPPISVPARRPELGPDIARGDHREPPSATQAPPPPTKGALPPMPPAQPSMSVPGTAAVQSAPQPAIVTVSLGDSTPTKASVASAPEKSTQDAKKAPRSAGSYMPSGSFTRAVLLGGLDAPTGGQSQRNPQPVLLRLTDNAILPNHFRFRVKECFVVAAGYGDISSERAYLRTETLSCVTHTGQALDIPIKGYVAGEDGKAGMRGRLVSKQGQLLANALIAGVTSGIGHAFQQGATSYSISPLGSTATVNQGEQLTAGIGTGVGRALDRLAQYYITLAEKTFPVIEVDAGRVVDVVITQGAVIEGLDIDENSPDAVFGALANREREWMRSSYELESQKDAD